MLLQSYINKWRISQLTQPDKLYINSSSTILLERCENCFIKYKKQIFPNDSHIHLRACDDASSYHCTYPIIGSNIKKWYCILNCCYDFPMMNAPFYNHQNKLIVYFLLPLIKLSSIYFKTYPNF